MNWREDLKEDYQELAALATSYRLRLERFALATTRLSAAMRPETAAGSLTMAAALAEALVEIERDAGDAAQSSPTWPDDGHDALVAQKRELADRLRSMVGVAAAVCVSLDFESPTYAGSQYSQAGVQTGQIIGTANDYKRDRHMDAYRFEHAFAGAFLKRRALMLPNVHVTSSGMAAFTTAFEAVRMSVLPPGPVLYGSGTYFETKLLLERLCPDRIEVDETDVAAVAEAVRTRRPAIVILDSLCNTESIVVPPMRALLRAIADHATRLTAVVVDNTGLGPTYDPFDDVPVASKIRPIVFESLNKYYQYGMDRVTGGIVLTPPITPFGILTWRMHLGTNIADASVHAIPEPNAALLARRFARFERNALWLARELDAFLKSHRTPVSHVNYPGLPSHAGYEASKGHPFHGSFLTLAFKPPYRRPLFYKAWVNAAIDEAKKAGVELYAGTSFGFDVTRVYLTALHADKNTVPFVRVSVGTETCAQLEALLGVFQRASERVSAFGMLG